MSTNDGNAQARAALEAPFDCPPITRIFDIDQYTAAQDAEPPSSLRRVALGRMIETGAERRLTQARTSTIGELAQLEARQPNCAEVIAYIRRHWALSQCAEPPILRWPPLLLDGPPGIGKTYFARALAHCLGSELTLINCASVTASFVLGGSTPSWRGSRPGRVFDALRESATANPIILLDEVDKLAGDARFDGYGPLYQLLEEDTARQFVDEHIGLPVDASRILWLATSNHPNALPEPIRSRLDILSIDRPDRDDVGSIVQSVYQNLLAHNPGWQRVFSVQLSPAVKAAMAGLPPRQIRRALMTAMGNAALHRRSRRKLCLRQTDIEWVEEPEARRIGFLP